MKPKHPNTDAYDKAVQTADDGGLPEIDVDDIIAQEREQTVDGIATLTPSPTARDDEDPSAFDESNVAGFTPQR